MDSACVDEYLGQRQGHISFYVLASSDHEVDVYVVSLKCSHPMDSFITTIADQLGLLYCLLTEGTCKNSLWWFYIIFLLDSALVS